MHLYEIIIPFPVKHKRTSADNMTDDELLAALDLSSYPNFLLIDTISGKILATATTPKLAKIEKRKLEQWNGNQSVEIQQL